MSRPRGSRSVLDGGRRRIARATASHRDRIRRSTADLRVLPDFLIIGAQKAGTTSLFYQLAAHPDVLRPTAKEVHFFDLNWHRGLGWYRAFFPASARVAAARALRGRRPAVGEASPYYLFHPAAPARMATVLAEPRLIVILRDPVARAYSHYNHEVRKGREPLTFADAMEAEPGRLQGTTGSAESWDASAAEAHRRFSYASRGLYADQLEAWWQHFPRESTHVIATEQMGTDPSGVLEGTLRFLGLPTFAPPRYEVRNAGRYDGMDPAVRDHLVQRFAEPNARLYDLLGRDLGWPR